MAKIMLIHARVIQVPLIARHSAPSSDVFQVDLCYVMVCMIVDGLFMESLHLAQPADKVAHRLASIPVSNTISAG